jgi:hypothetical protein
MRLTQGNASVLGTHETENLNLGFKKESKTAAASSSIDKLKASNFPASILRIGSWEVTNDFVFSVCIIVVVVILVHGLLRVCVFFFFWQYKSRYEGDLVAKCYFAKHKLVWEVLEGGLKSKIEIQWSDIMALKANCPDNGPGTLNVVVMY